MSKSDRAWYWRISDFLTLNADLPLLSRLRWTHLRGLGQSRLIATSYLWLALGSVAARAINWVDGTEFARSELLQDLSQRLGIPLSLVWLCLSAMSFILGQAIYAVRCPKIVKRYESFGEYEQAHALSRRPLTKMLHSLVTELPFSRLSGLDASLPRGTTGVRLPELDQAQARQAMVDKILTDFGYFSEESERDKYSTAFGEILDCSDKTRPWSMMLAGLFFLSGFGFFFKVAWESLQLFMHSRVM